MATYSAYRHVELDKVGCGKRRITKPPGGDTNEIFTTPNSTPPSTPRKVKNYMASNIFTPDGPVGNGGGAVEPRSVRHRPDDDSFGRLFGAQGKSDVTDSPRVKNLQKSSIIFADAGAKNGSTNGHGPTNGHGHSNGHNGATNGHGSSNGSSNGHGHENGSGSSTPNGHSNGVTNGGSNGVTNGDSHVKTNGTNGINGTNGTNGTNGNHAETNGSNGVSNGKRIPPGGFSSKLW